MEQQYFSTMLVGQCCVDIEKTFFLWGFLCFFSLPRLSLYLKELQTTPLWSAEQPNWPIQFLFCVQLVQLQEWCLFFLLFWQKDRHVSHPLYKMWVSAIRATADELFKTRKNYSNKYKAKWWKFWEPLLWWPKDYYKDKKWAAGYYMYSIWPEPLFGRGTHLQW